MSCHKTYILTCDGKKGRCDAYFQSVDENPILQNVGAVRKAAAVRMDWGSRFVPAPKNSGPGHTDDFCHDCAEEELAE